MGSLRSGTDSEGTGAVLPVETVGTLGSEACGSVVVVEVELSGTGAVLLMLFSVLLLLLSLLFLLWLLRLLLLTLALPLCAPLLTDMSAGWGVNEVCGCWWRRLEKREKDLLVAASWPLLLLFL